MHNILHSCCHPCSQAASLVLQGISGLDNAQTILDLTGQIPDIISDLLGYSVVPQQLQENQLLAGDTFNTTNVIKTGSGVNGAPAYIPIGIKTTTDMTQVCCCTCCRTASLPLYVHVCHTKALNISVHGVVMYC